MKTLDTDKIRIDGGTQPRTQIDMLTVAEYSEAMKTGATFPAVVVFYDGVDYWLADGFHRYHAAAQVNGKTIECEIHNGTQRDAVLYSVGANATHGMRRTNADKRRAVLTLLQDKEWAKWSDRKIAEKCAVSHEFVRQSRDSICQPLTDTRIVERNGKVYEMQTANIGRVTLLEDYDGIDFDNPVDETMLEQAETELSDRARHFGWTNDELTEAAIDLAQTRLADERAEHKKANYITLADWQTGTRAPASESGDVKMNSQSDTDNIEWAAWSWNPITGCLHNCEYCYARDIANRFYPYGFQPAYLPERLNAPANTKQGAPRWDGDIGYRNVFTCSMADLFGKWVPKEWITSVIQAAEQNPQWTFLFLTKFPVRMSEFTYPDNVWLGTSVDKQFTVERAESAFRKVKASGFKGVCWLSCEPMLERLQFTSLKMFDWVVMGGASKSSQTPEMRPPFDDIVSLYQQARASKCAVYMKTNLGIEQRVREYPGK